MTEGIAMRGLVPTLSTMLLIGGMSGAVEATDEDVTFRRANFSNEFELKTPEGINARGFAKVVSRSGMHRVTIRVDGLTPGAEFVVINHWFEPIPERGVGSSDPADDPSCTGHFQFLGPVPKVANQKGVLRVQDYVDQLAPHIWVVDLAKFLEVTNDGTQAPSGPEAFASGGLQIPFDDLLNKEAEFVDTDPLTDCSAS